MNLFAYGSLMHRPVWERLVPGPHRAEPGTIRGFERRRVAGEVYPALVRSTPGHVVPGILYRGVSAADLRLLDLFEDEGGLYHRIRLPVETASGAPEEAWTYLFAHPERVEDEAWDPRRFAAEHLVRFLRAHFRECGPTRHRRELAAQSRSSRSARSRPLSESDRT